MDQEYRGGMADAAAGASAGASGEAGDCNEERFRNFSAIQDVPPQKTLFLSVEGEVWVGNPGIEATLSYAEPQGMNPAILLLRLDLLQRPGFWPQVMTWKPAAYRTMLREHGQYRQVQIVHEALGSCTLDVVDRA